MRSRKRSRKNMKFWWKFEVKMRRLKSLNHCFSLGKTRFFEIRLISIFDGFGDLKSHQQSTKSAHLGGLRSDFWDFCAILRSAKFDRFSDRWKVVRGSRFLQNFADLRNPDSWFEEGRRRRRRSWSFRILQKSNICSARFTPQDGVGGSECA